MLFSDRDICEYFQLIFSKLNKQGLCNSQCYLVGGNQRLRGKKFQFKNNV